MKFSAQQDVAVPPDAVFDILCDVDELERAASDRGAQVQRLTPPPALQEGGRWQVVFDWRGASHTIELEIVALRPGDRLRITLLSKLFSGDIAMTLHALPKGCTRVEVDIEVSPRTIGARVLLQPVKLAKASADARLDAGVERAARRIEARYKSGKEPVFG